MYISEIVMSLAFALCIQFHVRSFALFLSLERADYLVCNLIMYEVLPSFSLWKELPCINCFDI